MKEFYTVVGKKDGFLIHGTFCDDIVEIAKKSVVLMSFIVIKYTFNGYHTVEETIYDSEKQD